MTCPTQYLNNGHALWQVRDVMCLVTSVVENFTFEENDFSHNARHSFFFCIMIIYILWLFFSKTHYILGTICI
jgi:hypothetical protein